MYTLKKKIFINCAFSFIHFWSQLDSICTALEYLNEVGNFPDALFRRRNSDLY